MHERVEGMWWKKRLLMALAAPIMLLGLSVGGVASMIHNDYYPTRYTPRRPAGQVGLTAHTQGVVRTVAILHVFLVALVAAVTLGLRNKKAVGFSRSFWLVLVGTAYATGACLSTIFYIADST